MTHYRKPYAGRPGDDIDDAPPSAAYLTRQLKAAQAELAAARQRIAELEVDLALAASEMERARRACAAAGGIEARHV